MTYYVTVENGTANRYKAAVIGWPNCVAEGKTGEEAVTLVKERFVERLNQVEIVPIEVESANEEVVSTNGNSVWMTFAGMYANISM